MNIEIIPAKEKASKIIRVAAYARVSSDKDVAFHSLEAQEDYYKEYVLKHPDWELVGIYSDNGISGTKVDRPAFTRMMEDARLGKVDLIITKSITRFARNTVALLQAIRELKALDVDCFFEKENMHSISPDGELFLTLLAMYAEEEAKSASENQKWRIRKLYKEGKVHGGKMYGYRLNDGVYQVVPEEAKVVQRIYEMYLSGQGCGKIARDLNADNVPSAFLSVWLPVTIRQILHNEKYTGELMLQKTYIEDFRTKKLKVNNGELNRYHVKDSHEAIIPREEFEQVQEEFRKRRAQCDKEELEGRKDKEYLFNGKMTCAKCGKRYRHKNSAGKNNKKPFWICKTYFEAGKYKCPSQKIPEEVLVDKTLEVLNQGGDKDLLIREELNRERILQEIDEIVVPGSNRLIYYLANGEVIETTWKHKSRSESWTKEMREKASKKARENAQKRRDEIKERSEE